jgi:hypothetical protein
MKSPRTWIGAVALAIVLTTAVCTLLAGMGWLIGSRWLFTGHHATIWIVGVGLVNAAVVITLALRKQAEDRKMTTPRPSPLAAQHPANPRRLSGPGGVYRARRR